MSVGIIVLGHGSKAPEALQILKNYGEMVKVACGCEIVEIASLQFNQPDLPAAIGTVCQTGVSKIIIVPFFLYNGIHLQEDIPAVLAEEKIKYPGVEIVLANHLGADHRLVEIVIDRIKEVS